MTADQVTVRNDDAAHRFEILVDGDVAGFAEYHDRGTRRSFTHTVVDPAYEGHGLGGRLVTAALAATRTEGLTVLPFCPFVRQHLLTHADELDLVPDAEREHFGLPADPPATRS